MPEDMHPAIREAAERIVNEVFPDICCKACTERRLAEKVDALAPILKDLARKLIIR